MVTRATFLEQAKRWFGRSNPERMDVAHWLEMVRSGEIADDAARRHLGDDASECPAPGWCFDRFGMTRTRLPDGRIVCVAGEHEDSYDPEFCIYNDVIVFGPGGDVAIYGYPEDTFPPTDFHTATRVGDRLILVGSIGYGGRRRYGHTPVYGLDLKTFAIEALATTGDMPGWIHRHHASLEPDGHTVRISGGKVARPDAGGKERQDDNDRVFHLDLRTMRWTAADGPWLVPPVPDVAWPPGWNPIGSQLESRDVADGLARSVGPDHPLFVPDHVPVATTGEAALVVLLRSVADPQLFMVAEGPTWCGRGDDPLKWEPYDGIESWLAAAEGRGEWWWPMGSDPGNAGG